MNSTNKIQASPPMSADEWYVYQESGQHVGPVTVDLLARGITAGKVPRNAYAGVAGASRWRPILEIPEIAAALRSLEQKPARVPSSMAPPAPPIGFATPPRVAQL